VPVVARSRHLGLAEAVAAIERSADRAARQRCRRLPNLDFQARCACGYDGQAAYASEALSEFEGQRLRLEEQLGLFFADDRIRSRVQAWVDQGIGSLAGARAYLEGAEPWPAVADLGALDDCLAGVEVVRSVPLSLVTRLLTERTWEPSALARAFAALVESWGAERVRFEPGPAGDDRDREPQPPTARDHNRFP
jgi:hypothetical protein